MKNVFACAVLALGTTGVTQEMIDAASADRDVPKNFQTGTFLASHLSPLAQDAQSEYHASVVASEEKSASNGPEASGCHGSMQNFANNCSGYARRANSGCSGYARNCSGRGLFWRARARQDARQSRRASRQAARAAAACSGYARNCS